MDIVKPKALLPGATIGIVCPSYWLDESDLATGINYLEQHGYKIKLGDSVKSYASIIAGSPELRAADINNMFADPDVDAILCARGGYGSNRVAPLLDYDLIANHAKVFIGFSDITGLLNAITERTGLVTFHGPMLINFARQSNDFTMTHMQQLLQGDLPISISGPSGCLAQSLRSGMASGKLCGGNLCLVVERLGTRFEIDTRDKILLLEDLDEKIYAIDRMMNHLKNSGSLEHIKGLIVGEMCKISDTEIPFGQSIEEVMISNCQEYDFPIISNFPAGHGEYIATLPIGQTVTVKADEHSASVEIHEAVVA